MTYEEAIKAIKCNYPPEHYSMLREALDIALEVIDKQIPKKPQEYELYTEDGELVHYEGCPNCRAILNKSHYFLKICHCGQKLEV